MEATLLKRIRGSLWLAALVAAGLFAFAACGDGAAAADGTVRAVGSDTLEIDTEEGPATILIDRDTEIEDQDGSRVDLEAITPGVEVRVRGDLREDGSIMAERIEVTLELPEGTPEGVSEATPEGVLEETPEGVSEETPEGVSEGTPEGTPEGISEGTPEGVSGELEFEGEVTAVTVIDINTRALLMFLRFRQGRWKRIKI